MDEFAEAIKSLASSGGKTKEDVELEVETIRHRRLHPNIDPPCLLSLIPENRIPEKCTTTKNDDEDDNGEIIMSLQEFISKSNTSNTKVSKGFVMYNEKRIIIQIRQKIIYWAYKGKSPKLIVEFCDPKLISASALISKNIESKSSFVQDPIAIDLRHYISIYVNRHTRWIVGTNQLLKNKECFVHCLLWIEPRRQQAVFIAKQMDIVVRTS